MRADELGELGVVSALIVKGEGLSGFQKSAELFPSRESNERVVLRGYPAAGEVLVAAVEPTDTCRLAFKKEMAEPREHIYLMGERQPRNGTCQLEVRAFQRYRLVGELDFLVDTSLFDDLRKLGGRRFGGIPRSDHDIMKWLEEEFLLAPRDLGTRYQRIIISEGRKLFDEPEDIDAFNLHGRALTLRIKSEQLEGGGAYLRVTRVLPGQLSGAKDRPMTLCEGVFNFEDSSEAGKVRAQAFEVKELLDKTTDVNAFMNIWNRYDELEQEITREKADSIGKIFYSSWRPNDDKNIEFTLETREGLSKQIEGLDTNIELVAVSKFSLFEGKTNDWTFSGKFVRSTERTLELKPRDEEEDPPDEGGLVYTLRGDEARWTRRQEARDKIVSVRTPMPNLNILLAGKTYPRERPDYVKPLTSRVKRKLFPNHQPTDSQRRAIEIALNTPDIAIIQGPPGTGKTTVINAIVERFAEMHDRDEIRGGAVLISGFQHDAVENALERIEVDGVPSMKIGKRGDRDDSSLSKMRLDQWRLDIIARIEESFTENVYIAAHEDLNRLESLYRSALVGGASPSQLASTLTDLRPIFLRAGASSAQLDRIIELGLTARRASSSRQMDPDLARAIRSVRNLRCHPISHYDDGPARAREALFHVEQIMTLAPEGIDLLEAMASLTTTPDEEDDCWQNLARLQRGLLLGLLPHSKLSSTVPIPAETIALLEELLELLRGYYRASLGAPERLSASLRDALRDDVDRAEAASIHYAVVHGSTCQQSAGNDLLDKSREVHDLVLIDEAARSNPLDLLIPMTRGKRVILVGDHRQLPHLVDMQIRRRILREHEEDKNLDEQGKTPAELVEEAIEESLFMTLYRTLVEQEEADGIKRRVTLDRQFRMHPRLGDFVRDHFYKIHGEPYESPLPAELFTHELGGVFESACALWADVPLSSAGQEGEHERSKQRPAEAVRVAKILKRLLADPGAGELSFGVITFYGAQVKQLQRALVDEGIGHFEEDHYMPPEPAEGFPHHERLRVGTVDAFQGKEFDVVILSMVRSNPYMGFHNERTIRQQFGHLCSPNRLCVALSRQKKLLIIVGDSEMLSRDDAREAIPALVAFHDTLCGGHHVDEF